MRNRAVDIAKGIAITLVVVGHISITPEAMKVWLYTFHIPLFFLCSGSVFRPEKYDSFLVFLKRRINSLVVPYFAMGISLYVLKNAYYLFLNHICKTTMHINWNPIEAIIGLVLGYRLHRYYFSLWFICVLFIAELIVFCFLRRYKGQSYVIPIVAIAMVFFQWLIFRLVNGFIWSLDLVPTGISFLLIGYYIGQIDTIMNKLTRWDIIAVLLIVNIAFGVVNYRRNGMTDLYYCKMGDPILFIVSAITGCLLVILICKKMRTSSCLEYLGRNSFVIYTYNNALTIPIAKDIVFAISKKSELLKDETLQWVMVCMFAVIVSCILVEIINRYFPCLIGKKGGSIYV